MKPTNRHQTILRKTVLAVLFLIITTASYSQSRLDTLFNKINPQRWTASLERKADKLQEKIISKSQKTLSKLQRQEEKVYKKMLKGKDSLVARAALAEINTKYTDARNKLTNISSGQAGQYIPKLDSITTALKFLDQNAVGGNLKESLSKVQSLQSSFQQAEDVKKFISERRLSLKGTLERLGEIKQLKKLNKEVYYYSAQVKEYKEMFNDSKKMERKALELLSKTDIFQKFMRENSQLASLFRMPGNGADPSSQINMAGLQTRAQVNNLVQQQIAGGGPNAQAQFQQNLQEAQGQINQLKNKLNQFNNGGSSDDIMPEGFKPNNQKTKSFLKRFEYGTNVQSQKPNGYFPVTSDIGLSLGYKLNDRSIVGIGASYKIGWGQNIRNISISSQGMGLRSFVDVKLKRSFWISGGYEMNYQSEFNRIDELQQYSAWQKSGLIGLSKVVSLKTKFFKKTKVQLLWDFLSYQQVPRTQPIVFRIGYTF